MLPALRCATDARSAGLAVHGVLAVLRAILLQLEPVGVVAPVLAGDVVAVLALLAGQGDLRTDVGGCHGCAPRLVGTGLAGPGAPADAGAMVHHADGPAVRGRSKVVAVTGFEPVTQRL